MGCEVTIAARVQGAAGAGSSGTLIWAVASWEAARCPRWLCAGSGRRSRLPGVRSPASGDSAGHRHRASQSHIRPSISVNLVGIDGRPWALAFQTERRAGDLSLAECATRSLGLPGSTVPRTGPSRRSKPSTRPTCQASPTPPRGTGRHRTSCTTQTRPAPHLRDVAALSRSQPSGSHGHAWALPGPLNPWYLFPRLAQPPAGGPRPDERPSDGGY
jgi:hypothetical protein